MEQIASMRKIVLFIKAYNREILTVQPLVDMPDYLQIPYITKFHRIDYRGAQVKQTGILKGTEKRIFIVFDVLPEPEGHYYERGYEYYLRKSLIRKMENLLTNNNQTLVKLLINTEWNQYSVGGSNTHWYDFDKNGIDYLLDLLVFAGCK